MKPISKSDYLSYRDSPMHLWAGFHDKLDIAVPSLYNRFIMEQGQELESIAETYLKEKFSDLELFTQRTFSTGHFLARPDIVVVNPKSGLLDIYEIKSSSSVKKDHKYDLTFQYLVCNDVSPIGNVYIVHINKEFIRSGEINFSTFFNIANLNETVSELSSEVRVDMKMALEIVNEINTNNILGCLKPKICCSLDLCHKNLPEHSIFEISRIGKKARILKEDGILSIKDIPIDFPLSTLQSFQAKAVQENKVQLNPIGINNLLEKLDYPLYFLDYETFNPAIPMFDGYSPYQQITFQFSLHTLPAPGEKLIHSEFLHSKKSDPAKILASELKKHIGDKGSIIAWNQSFEKGRNSDMAAMLPEYKSFLEDLNDRMFDLMRVFSKGHFVHQDFLGSSSLKNVLPVLVPDLNYSGLVISNGEQAMLAWKNLMELEFSAEDKEQLIFDMLEYCKLDTLAMVEILRVVQETISN